MYSSVFKIGSNCAVGIETVGFFFVFSFTFILCILNFKICFQVSTCVASAVLKLSKWSLPYILAYKPTIFGTILTFKLWGSAYTRVMPHSQSRQSARWLSVSAAQCVWATHGVPYTISRSLGLRGCVGESTLAGFWMTTHRLVLLLHSQPL